MQASVFIAPILSAASTGFWVDHLTDLEKRRMSEIKSERRRLEFVCSRLLAKQSLVSEYGGPQNQWTIEVKPDGSLLVKRADGLSVPSISLSHSKGRVACAFADVEMLGLDIELLQARKNLPGLAEDILHPEEWDEFSGLDFDGKTRYFYAKWVVKEALGKALGCGINYPMREFLICADRLLKAPQVWIADPQQWAFSQVFLDDGYSLGLAWRGGSVSHFSIKSAEIRL